MANLKAFTETVHYRESKRILDIVDRVAGNRGIQRCDIIREATRYFLAESLQLTEQERIDIGSRLVDRTGHWKRTGHRSRIPSLTPPTERP